MSEYSKSGPRSYSVQAKQRENEKKDLLRRMLALPTEAEFIAELRESLGISKIIRNISKRSSCGERSILRVEAFGKVGISRITFGFRKTEVVVTPFDKAKQLLNSVV